MDAHPEETSLRAPQNRRGPRVTVVGFAEIDLPLRSVELAEAIEAPFEVVTLEEGGPPEERSFRLVPKDSPGSRVEAALGDPLVLSFRPSVGRSDSAGRACDSSGHPLQREGHELV